MSTTTNRTAKVFTIRELRDSYVSLAVRDAAGYGPHAQGTFYVLAATKRDAFVRLQALRFPVQEQHLRVVLHRDLPGPVRECLVEPGDVVTGDRHAGRRLVRVPAFEAEPVVVGTWSYDENPRVHPERRYHLVREG